VALIIVHSFEDFPQLPGAPVNVSKNVRVAHTLNLAQAIRGVSYLPVARARQRTNPVNLVRQFFPRLETDGLARWDVGNFTGARVSPNATFAGFDHKHPKPAQLNPFATFKCLFESLKQGIHSDLCLGLGNPGDTGNAIDDVKLDHGSLTPKTS
jgi:hypothetical protein